MGLDAIMYKKSYRLLSGYLALREEENAWPQGPYTRRGELKSGPAWTEREILEKEL